MVEEHNADETRKTGNAHEKMKVSRRRIMKQLSASAVAFTGVSGLSTAATSSDLTQQLVNYHTEELTSSQTQHQLKEATLDGPGKNIVRYIEDKGLHIGNNSLSGQRISSNAFPEHVLIDARLRKGTNQSGNIQLRVYDEQVTPQGMVGTVTAEAIVEGTAYRSTPLTTGNESSGISAVSSQTVDTVDDGVVNSLEWQNSRISRNDGISTQGWPWNCMVSGTYGAGGAVCTVLAGITGIAGGILMLIPEPGSTAVGTVAVSTVLTGSCTLGEGLERLLNVNCDINSLGLCVTYPGIVSPPDIYVFPAGDCYM